MPAGAKPMAVSDPIDVPCLLRQAYVFAIDVGKFKARTVRTKALA
jgi:hypothetical protein